MPSDTFFRLPEPKRRRIFEAALDEFSSHRFSDASINRIIKAAGIPRGSFYQYFENKEDIYIHILQQISKEKLNIFSAGHLQWRGKMNFYELLCSVMPPIFEWAEQNPRYNRFGLLMMADDSEFVRRMLLEMRSSREYMYNYLREEQLAGGIRDDIEVENILEFIILIALPLLRDYYESGNKDEAMARIKSTYKVLCYGILPR